MKYAAAKPEGKVLYYEIRNDSGMVIGNAIENASPFEGCEAVTLEDAEKNARLWAASDDMLEALEHLLTAYAAECHQHKVKNYLYHVPYEKAKAAINKAKGITKPEKV